MEEASRYTPKRRNLLERFLAYRERLQSSDRFLLTTTLIIASAFLLITLTELSMRAQNAVPAQGGVYTEGIVGTPRFINPVLAVTGADKDLTALIYDSLLKLGPNGTLEPRIAESVTVSEDHLTYNVVLRKDVFFHDGAPLTA